MPVHPQVKTLLEQMAALGNRPLAELSPQEARDGYRALGALTGQAGTITSVTDRSIPGPEGEIPVRIYVPEGAAPHPGLVYLHGGGWVIGDLDTHDGTARQLASGAGCVVVSVDYRLAPEHPFPAAVDDAFAAVQWLHASAAELGIDAGRIAIGGDSAGGNLAAVVTHLARDRGGPPLRFLLLVYPVTDARLGHPSIDENAEGYLLTKEGMQWFVGHYLGTHDPADPLASPLLARDLSGLPPALIITAEYDPLRDEGEAYGERLRQAGVPVTVSRYDGMIHGFVGLGAVLEDASKAIDEATTALRAALAP